MDATAMTLGEGQGKVIQYISPDPYIKSFCGGGRGRGGNGLKT